MAVSEMDRLFHFNVNFRLGMGIFMVADFLALMLFITTIPSLLPSGLFLPLLGLFGGLLTIFLSATLQVRKAEFYENYFTVNGWKLKKQNHSYSEVKHVVLAQGPWPNKTVTLVLKGEREDTLTLTKNPRSHELDIDLYTWLKEKIGRSAEDDALSET